MKNKKFLLSVLIILALLTPFSLYSQGNVDINKTEKAVVRVSDTMPGLITPGVWNGQTFSLNSSIYEYLVALDATDNSLSPELATSWSTDDGKVWNIEVRKDVTFHDGSELTSEDVKYTIQRTQDTTLGHAKKADFAAVESIEIVDEYNLIITLKEKRPTFIYQFTDYNMAILSSEYDYATLGETKPMGTGAFRLKTITPKESAVLVKNNEYWNPAYPLIDELQIYFSPDAEVSLSMLISDQVDVVPFITPVMRKRIADYPELKVIIPYQEQRFLSMAVDTAPFDDNRVRLAIKYAMDPKFIARAANLELGNGIDYGETPIMSLLPQYEPFPLRERNVEKAKALLKEAGYPKGITITLTYASDHAFNQGLVQAIKELAKDANINIQLKGYPRDIYFAQYWLNEPFTLTTWGGRADPSMLLNLGYRSDGPWNESHLNDKKLDNLIDKISAEVDEDVRNVLYKELQLYFIENGAMINIQVPYFVAMNQKIAGYEQPLTMLPNYKKVYIKK